MSAWRFSGRLERASRVVVIASGVGPDIVPTRYCLGVIWRKKKLSFHTRTLAKLMGFTLASCEVIDVGSTAISECG